MFRVNPRPQPEPAYRISPKAVVLFLLSLTACALVVFTSVSNRADIEKMAMERLIVDKSIAVTNVLSRLLYKTEALAALIIQSDGKIDNFSRIAPAFVDDSAIHNILIAPGGVVSDVYPLEGNEGIIGFNLLGEGAGNKETIMAKELDRLVFGGPFPMMQGGGQALVGRLPVRLKSKKDGLRFWGLVSVTLKYPQALQAAGLTNLKMQGFAYEIWRVNPDDGQRQRIAHSKHTYNENAPYIEERISILNTDWFFRLSPVRMWYEYSENWMLIALGFTISLLLGLTFQKNEALKAAKIRLERMALTDPLTGLWNRAGLFRRIDGKAMPCGAFHLWYIDLDDFKNINDTYGHSAGDVVLKNFCATVLKHTGPKHIFARVGGDEFVLLCLEPVEPQAIQEFWKKVELEFAEPLHHTRDGNIYLHFSRGMAVFPDNGATMDELLSHADKNMYRQKSAWRASLKKKSAAGRADAKVRASSSSATVIVTMPEQGGAPT